MCASPGRTARARSCAQRTPRGRYEQVFVSVEFYDRRVLVAAPPPAWIQRAPIPPPIVAWRLADVLGTPVVEGIAVDLDRTAGTLTVNVVDSRTNPPHIARLRGVKGTKVRWLRAGARDGLRRSEVAIDVVDRGKEAAYLLRVGKKLQLQLVRTAHGSGIAPTVFRS